MKRLATFLLALAACVLTAGCNLERLAYSNAAFAYANAAPPALKWMVGDYVDLSGEQKDWLRERVDAAFAWHRAQELPQYQQFCEALAARAADGFTVEQARQANKELRAYYNRTLDHVIPDLADLLLRLDAEQVAQLERKFAKDNAKMVRDSREGTLEERNAARAKKYTGHLEEFVGSLSDAQLAIVEARASRYDDMTEMRLADRQYRQAETLRMIRARVSRDEMIAGLHRLLVDTQSWRSAEYRQKLREREENMFAMIAEVSGTLTPAQRTHLAERMRGFIDDIGTLVASR